MIRKIRFSVLLLLLTVFFAAGSMPVQAVTIGELLGWNTEEDKKDGSDAQSSRDDSSRRDQEKKGGSLSADGKDKSGNDGKNKSSEIDYESLELEEDGTYDSKDEVCAYLIRYHRLPDNYMTKKEARKLGWEGGSLDRLIPGRSIGGDFFGNYEGTLPEKDGREYHECDIDTIGSSGRGPKRIIYSGDDDNEEWNIYYTDDHYESFTLLWGEDDYE
jgi:hypothetical protein